MLLINTSSLKVATTAIVSSICSWRIIVRVAVEGDGDTAAGGAGGVHGGVGQESEYGREA